jgi:sulfonate transport system permease protein
MMLATATAVLPGSPRQSAFRVPHWARRGLGLAILLACWAVGSAVGVIGPQELPGPVAIIRSFSSLLANGELASNMWSSVGRVAIGLSIGVGVGLALAVISGLTRIGEHLVDAPMQLLRTLPILALTPLDILWFGIGNPAKIVLIVFGVSFPIYLNTFAAIRSIDNRYIELASSLELSWFQLLVRVVIPGSLPGFLVGLRYAVGISWLILVVSEQINANSGIGYLMNQAQQLNQVNVVVVCLVVYGALGVTSDAFVRFLERRALAWRSSFTGS